MKRDVKYNGLSPDDTGLLHAANEAMTSAYNIYSDFAVGSSLITISNKIITGVNMENAAYPAALCAERNAISSAITQGFMGFPTIAVIAKPKVGCLHDIVTPCGMCRQVIFEFYKRTGINTRVIMSNTDMTKIKIWNISDLLPLGFGPDALKK